MFTAREIAATAMPGGSPQDWTLLQRARASFDPQRSGDVVVLLTLDNLGIDITALVAVLGIGGIAVALAVQNIFGDLFASLSITLDRPSVVGDFLIVGDVLGTVETIGIKSTRLRSLSGWFH